MIPLTTLDAFKVILREVKEMFPGSSPVIGGGALRDAFHHRPIKDVDVFLRAQDHEHLSHPFTSLLIPEFIGEYCGRHDLHGVWDVAHQIAGFDVQLILADFEDMYDLAGTFDLGLSRATYDGSVVFFHPDFVDDTINKVFRICRDDNAKEIARSQRRITRLLQKYPEFTAAA